MRRIHRPSGFTLIELLTVITVLGVLAAVLIPRFWLAYDRAKLTACKSNLQNIATGLHVYASEYDSLFPNELGNLIPNYMKAIPLCPATKTITYTAGYEVNYTLTSFTLSCHGTNHPTVGMGANEPYYIFGQGMGPPE